MGDGVMGTYLNPGNGGFAQMVRTDYVDKTGLICLVNETIGTSKNLTCISRPRRFGKSYAAKMLCAYYDGFCDSRELFSGYAVSRCEDFEKHLNKYHVISLDVTGFISDAQRNKKPLADVPNMIDAAINSDVKRLYPELGNFGELNECLLELVRMTGTQIVFVIDEWDSIIREARGDGDARKSYLGLLRGWFKNNNFTPEAVAAAYMTGILPIKKDGSQSAISDFEEYSMLAPGRFDEYVGFTEAEVMTLCEEKGVNFRRMKKWYDGYVVGNTRSVYNPYSVMQAAGSGSFKSYWKTTSAAEALMAYMEMDQEGLQDDMARLVAGESVTVDADSFQNDMETFTCKDDVLTLLVHLGYLTYEEVSDSYDDDDDLTVGIARIPNEEIRTEFEKSKKHSCEIGRYETDGGNGL